MDVWLEGPSGDEPSGHQSINVGNPNGAYASYSFGMDAGLDGEVYRDEKLGGVIERYKKTTKEYDEVFKAVMEKKVGEKGMYLVGDTCRSWSQKQFERVPYPESTPPPRPPPPKEPWYFKYNPLISTSKSAFSSGTSTSR